LKPRFETIEEADEDLEASSFHSKRNTDKYAADNYEYVERNEKMLDSSIQAGTEM
jgi:hypothetical protein